MTQWQPIGFYDPRVHPFFVLIGGEGWTTVGVKEKYWHDLTDGDWRVTSPSVVRPTHWMPLPQPPHAGDTQ